MSGCTHHGGVIVCSPRTFNWRSRRHCPTCNKHRWMLVEMAVWYAPTITCLGCGERWDGDEGRYPRPFQRDWRPKAVAAAKRRPWTTKAAAYLALRSEIEEYTA